MTNQPSRNPMLTFWKDVHMSCCSKVLYYLMEYYDEESHPNIAYRYTQTSTSAAHA